MSPRHSWIAVLLLAAPARGAEPVDYARDVKPIFAAHCATCHGPTKQKADLRLDLYARIKQGGNSGPAIAPNKSADSLLIQAVTASKPDVARMPPKGAVPPEQIAILKRWIDEGAKGPAAEEATGGGRATSHWSFQPVKRPALLHGRRIAEFSQIPPWSAAESWAQSVLRDTFGACALDCLSPPVRFS